MKSFFYTLVILSGILISLNGYSQMSGTYYVNNGDQTTSFANLTGPRNSVGSIKITAGSASVVGSGTAFTAAMVGTNLYTAPTTGAYCPIFIGTIASRTSATAVTLTAPYGPGLPTGTLYCGTDAPGAFATINALSLSGNVTIYLSQDQSLAALTLEPGTNALTGTGLNSHTITIANGGGSNIEGSNLIANASGVIRLSGCSNVTIGDNLLFRNDYTTTPGPDLVFTGGANHNTIQNCTFETRNTTNTAGGSATVGAINFGVSAVAGGNSFNTITNCAIRDRTDVGPFIANNGICSFGSTTAANYNVHNTISNCTFDNIENYEIWVTATGNGDAWQITGNHFYMDKAAVPSTVEAMIYFNSSTSNGNNISGNYNDGWSVSSVGPFIGIYALAGTTSPTTITGNTIQNMTLTSAGASIIYGIQAAGGTLTIGGPNTSDGNTITNFTKGGTTAVAAVTGINVTGGTNLVIKNNIINTLTNNGTTTSPVYGINISGGANLATTYNSITSLTNNGTTTCPLYGINTTGTTGTNVISYNTINSFTNAGTAGALAGINIAGGTIITADTNDISSLTHNGTGAATLYGIFNTGGTTLTIKGNQIYTLRLAGTTGVQSGIFNGTATGMDIEFNNIYDLGNAGTGTLAGINLTAGTAPIIKTNTISSLTISGSGAVASILGGIYTTGTVTNADIESNSITSLANNNASSTGAAAGINTTTSGASVVIKSNTINTFTLDGTGALAGVLCAPGAVSTLAITNNAISSMTRTNSTGTMVGIGVAVGTGASISNISGNVISGLISPGSVVGAGSASSVCGIYDYTTGIGQNIYNNTISDLENTYVGANVINITGIALNGATTNTTPFNICARNNILISGSNINGATLNAANIVGTDIITGAYEIVNNMIMLGDVTNVNTKPYTISGIKKAGASVDHVYFNNVFIVGKTSSTANNSYAYNSTANTADIIKNNIFCNKRSNTGGATGIHYAMFFQLLNVFDYNNYFTGGTGGLLSNGNATVPLKAGQDAHSLNLDPFFTYSTTLTPGSGNLHTFNRCGLGGKGLSLASNTPAYIEDGFGITPRANPPDIGADEFAAPYTYSATTINPSTASINKCSPTPAQLAAATTYCTAVTYAWSPSAGLSATNISNPTANPTVTTTYTVIATDAGLNTSSATVVVSLDPNISIANASVCVGSTTAQLPYDGINGSPDQYSIVWDATAHSAGLTDVTNATLDLTAVTGFGMPVIQFTVPGTLTSGNIYNGTFSVKISSIGCASAGIPFTLTVVAAAPPNVAFTFSQSPSPAHAGDNVTLTTSFTPSTPPAFDYEWIPIDYTGFSGYGTVTNSLSDVPGLTSNINYDGTSIRGPGNTWWIIFAENACGGVSDQGALKYSQVVPKTTFTNPTSCLGTDGSISFPGLAPNQAYDITYLKNSVSQTPIVGLTADATGLLKMTGLSTGIYSNIILSDEYYLAVPSVPADAVTLTAASCAPTAYAVTGGTNCGSTTVGVANSQSGVTYTLKLNGVNQTPTVPGTGTSISFGAETSAGTYTVLGTDGSGNTTLMTGSAVVNTVPTVNSVTSQTVCNNSNTTAITFSGTGATSYSWTNSTTSIGLAASSTGNIALFTATNAGTTPVTGTLVVTPQTAFCNGSTTSFTITVNPTPIVNSVTSQTVCNSGNTTAINFSGTATSYTWSNSTTSIGLAASGSGNISSFTSTNSGASPLVATVIVTPHYLNNAVTCDGSTTSFTITINPTPTVNSVTSQTVCNSGNTTAINFSGTATSYTWSNSTTSIGLAASGTGNISSFTGANSGTAPVVATVTVTPHYLNNAVTCDGSTTSFTITINPTPTVNSVISQTICNNASVSGVSFTGTGTSYTWVNSTTSIGLAASGTGDISSFTGSNAGNTFVTASVTATPHYTNNSVTCNGSTTNFTITVNSTPTVNSVSDQAVCNTGTTSAVNFGGSGTSYTWTNSTTSIGLGASGTGNISSFTASNAGTSPVVATVTVTPHYTNNSVTCDGSTTSFNITVNRTPAISVFPITSNPCSTDTTTVTASGTSTGYSWSPTTQLDAPTGASNRAFPSASTTYTVTGTDANGCTNSTTSAFTVRPIPVITVNPPSAVCTGTLSSTLVAGGAASYVWLPNVFLNTNTAATVTAQISELTFYTVTGTGANGCTANSDEVPVATVPAGGNALPPISIICSGGTQTLSDVTAAGNSYKWQISTDDKNWSDIAGATKNNYTTSSANGTTKKYYRLLAESDACYNVASSTAIVDISATPIVTVTNVSSTSATVTWTPYGIGQYNISWSGTAGSGSANAVTTNNFLISSLLSNKDLLITVTPATIPACGGVSPGSVSTHTLCSTPTILNVSATPFHGFKVNWTAVTGASSYRVYYRDLATQGTWSFVDTAGTAKTINVPYGGHKYAVYVAAKDCPSSGNMGEGSALGYVDTNPGSSCSPVPTVLASSSCPNQIHVDISGSSPPYYLILRRISPGLTSGVSYAVSTASVNITVGTQYAGSTWEIFATKNCGGGIISTVSNVSVVTVKPGCPTITNLVLSHPTCYGFTASWNGDDCAGLGISGYQLLIKKDGSPNYNGYPVGTGTHAVIGWLNPGLSYDVVVMSVACNGATSAFSIPDTIATGSCGRTGDEQEAIQQNITGSDKESVTVYPNPSQGQFFVDLGRTDNSEAGVKIELVNQIGQVIQTNLSNVTGGHLNQLVTTPEGLATGIYFVRTSIEGNVYVNKLMITKE